MKTYPYITEDNFKNPQDYMFSIYGGEDFLKSYFKTRNERLTDGRATGDKIDVAGRIASFMGKETAIENSLREHCMSKGDSRFKLSSWFLHWRSSESKDARKILLGLNLILLLIEQENIKNDVYDILSIFVRKFEVSKKIFPYYGINYKNPIGKANSPDVSLYIYLSLASLLFYDKTENLKFLNVALKLNDTVCSAEHTINNTDLKYISEYCFSLETAFVRKILFGKGIQI